VKIAIAGFGTIGRTVGKRLDEGIEGLSITAVSAGNLEKASANLNGYRSHVQVVANSDLTELADIIVECAPASVFMEIAVPVLKAGKTLVTVSSAAILEHPEIIELARQNDAQIILATGALLGLDAVRAAAEGEIRSVHMITRKPPKSFMKAKYIVDNHIDISGLNQALKIFEGTAKEGAIKFPANVNVAASLGLAGIGPEKTHLEIWADPAQERNTHTIKVDADSASFEMTIANVPTEENPATGKITALSVIAALRSLASPLRVGT
jgi:aspartate dehydrogenase